MSGGYPGRGEAWTCATCGKAVLGEGAWGIAPQAVCHCCVHDKRPIPPVSQLDQRWSLKAQMGSQPLNQLGINWGPWVCADKPYFWLGREAEHG